MVEDEHPVEAGVVGRPGHGEGRLGVGPELGQGDPEPHPGGPYRHASVCTGGTSPEPKKGEQPDPGGWGARGPVLFS